MIEASSVVQAVLRVRWLVISLMKLYNLFLVYIRFLNKFSVCNLKGKYAMAEYEKVKRITFPLENYHLLLMTTEIEADHVKIIDNVLNVMKS
jgi:hypothetical protein